jgi:hypothetical protein
LFQLVSSGRREIEVAGKGEIWEWRYAGAVRGHYVDALAAPDFLHLSSPSPRGQSVHRVEEKIDRMQQWEESLALPIHRGVLGVRIAEAAYRPMGCRLIHNKGVRGHDAGLAHARCHLTIHPDRTQRSTTSRTFEGFRGTVHGGQPEAQLT